MYTSSKQIELLYVQLGYHLNFSADQYNYTDREIHPLGVPYGMGGSHFFSEVVFYTLWHGWDYDQPYNHQIWPNNTVFPYFTRLSPKFERGSLKKPPP